MKLSTIYRNAAKRVAQGHNQWSCCAVAGVPDSDVPETGKNWSALNWYERLFAPHDRNPGLLWGNLWDYDISGIEEPLLPRSRGAAKECRILALCFMAAIAEAEGL